MDIETFILDFDTPNEKVVSKSALMSLLERGIIDANSLCKCQSNGLIVTVGEVCSSSQQIDTPPLPFSPARFVAPPLPEDESSFIANKPSSSDVDFVLEEGLVSARYVGDLTKEQIEAIIRQYKEKCSRRRLFKSIAAFFLATILAAGGILYYQNTRSQKELPPVAKEEPSEDIKTAPSGIQPINEGKDDAAPREANAEQGSGALPENGKKDAAAKLAALTKDERAAVVVVEYPDNAGGATGFFCMWKGRPAIVTNKHVVVGGAEELLSIPDYREDNIKTFNDFLSIRDNQNNVYTIKGVLLAKESDVAVIDVEESPPYALEIAEDINHTANIDDDIVIPGNPRAAGTIRPSNGKIVGIGPLKLEHNAITEAGNSGSPIIHAKSRGVLAVHTLVRYEQTTQRKRDGKSLKLGGEAIKVRPMGCRLDVLLSGGDGAFESADVAKVLNLAKEAMEKEALLEAQKKHVLMKKELSALVTIGLQDEIGCGGSGFITEISGKKFVVTNLHVIEGVCRVGARKYLYYAKKNVHSLTLAPSPFMDAQHFGASNMEMRNRNKGILDINDMLSVNDTFGNRLDIKSIFLPQDRDMALLEIDEKSLDNRISPLICSDDIQKDSQVGDFILVPGNRSAAGTIINKAGKIVGYGAGLLETDVDVAPGNSGGPVIHEETRKVLGIITYGYNGRKFSTRIDNAFKDSEWVDWAAFERWHLFMPFLNAPHQWRNRWSMVCKQGLMALQADGGNTAELPFTSDDSLLDGFPPYARSKPNTIGESFVRACAMLDRIMERTDEINRLLNSECFTIDGLCGRPISSDADISRAMDYFLRDWYKDKSFTLPTSYYQKVYANFLKNIELILKGDLRDCDQWMTAREVPYSSYTQSNAFNDKRPHEWYPIAWFAVRLDELSSERAPTYNRILRLREGINSVEFSSYVSGLRRR